MENGKPAGIDGLVAEHLKFSHPVLIVILCKLFNQFIDIGRVPDDFGLSYTVPIPKCDARCRDLCATDFRGISKCGYI